MFIRNLIFYFTFLQDILQRRSTYDGVLVSKTKKSVTRKSTDFIEREAKLQVVKESFLKISFFD